jgi:hypothetical protein
MGFIYNFKIYQLKIQSIVRETKNINYNMESVGE